MGTKAAMLLIFKDLKKVLSFLVSVIARLDRAIQRNGLDYPVEPDNDKHWNEVRYDYRITYNFRTA